MFHSIILWFCGLAIFVQPSVAELSKNISELSAENERLKQDLQNLRTNFSCLRIPDACQVLPHDNEAIFQVACNALTSTGAWTVVQRRIDGSENFFRVWSDYRAGFGNVTGEFFIGLENLHLITTKLECELLIEMEDFDNDRRYVKYEVFKIGNESEKYALKELGKHSGSAGDSLIEMHKSQKFSTKDNDNDEHIVNCAQVYKGGWWYKNCHTSNLNGHYGNNKPSEGINWKSFRDTNYSLKSVEMKIRRRKP